MRRHALNLGNALWSGPVGPLRYPEVPITGAITLGSSAWNRMHVCSGTSANYTVGLPACAGHAGDVLGFRMAPLASLSKLVTLDGNASELIDGALTRIMWGGESAFLLCDGSHWFKFAGKPVSMQAQMGLNADQADITSGINTKVAVETSLIDTTGLMVSTANKRIDIVRPGVYAVVGAVQFSYLSAAGRSQSKVYKNGVNQVNSEGYGIAATYGCVPIPGLLNLVAGDYLELWAFQVTGSGQGFINFTNDGVYATNLLTWEVQTW